MMAHCHTVITETFEWNRPIVNTCTVRSVHFQLCQVKMSAVKNARSVTPCALYECICICGVYLFSPQYAACIVNIVSS